MAGESSDGHSDFPLERTVSKGTMAYLDSLLDFSRKRVRNADADKESWKADVE